MSAPATITTRRYLDVREAAMAVRLTAAHVKKARPTPKPCLEVLAQQSYKLCAMNVTAVVHPSCRKCSVPRRHLDRECHGVVSQSCQSNPQLRHAPERCESRVDCAARNAPRRGESLPTGDVWNQRRTCPVQNQKFSAIAAKRRQLVMLRAKSGPVRLRDRGFSCANFAPVIHGNTVTQTQCN